MAEWWNGFLYGATSISVVEVVAATVIIAWVRRRDKKAAAESVARIFSRIERTRNG